MVCGAHVLEYPMKKWYLKDKPTKNKRLPFLQLITKEFEEGAK